MYTECYKNVSQNAIKLYTKSKTLRVSCQKEKETLKKWWRKTIHKTKGKYILKDISIIEFMPHSKTWIYSKIRIKDENIKTTNKACSANVFQVFGKYNF